jgi:hypothetical protein
MENSEIINIASFDIGKRNFCFYIQETDISELKTLSPINTIRYNENGTPTEEMKNIIQKVSLNGKTVIHVNKDLTKNTDKSKYLDKDIYYNMIEHLDEHKDYFDKCSYFIIEGQIKKNTMAMKLAQHCYSYFMIKYGKSKNIIEFPAYYKTCTLGCERIFQKTYKNGKNKFKTIDQRSRKKWSVEKAFEILKLRGEEDTLNNIKSKSKKDDFSDTLLQTIAFQIEYFIFKKIM